MKQRNLIVGLILAMAAGISAADTQNLAVSAKITGVCKFTGSTPVDFGSLDASGTADATATGNVKFWCTKNASYTLSTNDGAHPAGTQKQMTDGAAGDLLPYSLTLASTTGTGSGPGTEITVNANGTITAAAYQAAVAGTYNDTVVVTIAP